MPKYEYHKFGDPRDKTTITASDELEAAKIVANDVILENDKIFPRGLQAPHSYLITIKMPVY